MRWTIRDLLFATAIVGLAVGWWIEYRSHETTKREHQRADAAVGGMKEMLEGRGFVVNLGEESVSIQNNAVPPRERWGGQAYYGNRSNPFQEASKARESGGARLIYFPAVVVAVAGIVLAAVVMFRFARPRRLQKRSLSTLPA